MTTASVQHRPARLSLQPPAGLPPIPRSPVTPKDSSPHTVGRVATQHAHGRSRSDSQYPSALDRRESDASDLSTTSSGSDVEGETLMGCMMHLSVCSLPPHFDPHQDNGVDGGRKSRSRGPVMARFPAPPTPVASSPLGTREQQRKVYLGPKLSDRATGGPDAGPLIERFSCLFKDQYHRKTNPKGIVSMGVAENFLMQEECIKLFTNGLEQGLRFSDLSYGDNLWGSRRLNAALAGYYNQYFDPAIPVQPEHLVTGNGCSAVLDQLFYSLMDEGEAVLVAAPYYTGFDRDLIPRARVRLVPVDVGIDDGAFSPSCLRAFDAKVKELKAEGIVTRAIILCNPQNPLGRTYSRETLIAYAKWCEENDVHLVSDEIYAMSVYESINPATGEQEKFTSMLSLRHEELGEGFDRARLHVVYGMSKDFCANGLRVGSLVSQYNPLLLRTLANTSMLMKISSPSDIIWSHILTQPTLLSGFLTENRTRLSEAHAFTREWFESRGVPVSYGNSGHFIWVHLGGVEALKITSPGTEKKVFQKLLDGGVYIAPGTAYHCSEPGWFRVTFSIAREDLLVGLAKIESILNLRPIRNGA